MDGLLVIEKPAGITSHDVVDKVRKILSYRKVGHAGTLDPFATGLLLIGLNQGTKLFPFLQKDEKEYEAVIRLGIETDTLDITGKITASAELSDICVEKVMGTVGSFVGKQSQVPPRYSAIKQNGIPGYKRARMGMDFTIPPREIEIFSIALLDFTPPSISIRVRCSGGTYIRSLARDIGDQLGCGGCLESLRRVRSGRFRIEEAVSLDSLRAEGQWFDHVVHLKDALSLNEIAVSSDSAAMIRNGRVFEIDNSSVFSTYPGASVKRRIAYADITSDVNPEYLCMITSEERLVAVGQEAGGTINVLRVFNEDGLSHN